MKIVQCKDKNEASQKAIELLLKDVDSSTLLLLSGGTSPDFLYQLIAHNKVLRPGAVALIDERFGLPMHDSSNEKMISDTGLLEYLNKEGIAVYRILNTDDIGAAAVRYEHTIKRLFKKFSNKVAVVGIGADGHTAGIKPGLEYDHSKLVVAFDDINGSFGKRITLTFEALQEINKFIIMVVGENEQSSRALQGKKEALEKMFIEQDYQKLPAVFYNRITAKVVLLTTFYPSSIVKE